MKGPNYNDSLSADRCGARRHSITVASMVLESMCGSATTSPPDWLRADPPG